MSAAIVSLFSGYGGLEMGVQSVVGGEVVAHVEFDEAPSRILAHHWPDVPNLGDITAIDWNLFLSQHPEIIDLCFEGYRPGLIVTGGFPCQDVSLAGLRRGLKDGTRSGLWSEFARAIDMLRPELVVIENVRGLLSAEADRNMESDPWGVGDGPSRPTLRALGAVLGDLAALGYDAQWCGVRAADAGAPHGRFRVFIVARPADAGLGRRDGWSTQPATSGWRGRDTAGNDPRIAADADCDGRESRSDSSARREAWGADVVDRHAPADTDRAVAGRGATRDMAGPPRSSESPWDQREWHGDAARDRSAVLAAGDHTHLPSNGGSGSPDA